MAPHVDQHRQHLLPARHRHVESGKQAVALRVAVEVIEA